MLREVSVEVGYLHKCVNQSWVWICDVTDE